MALPRYIPHYTIEEFSQWEGRWELWSGVPVAMSPSPDKRHQKLAGDLYFLLRNAVRDQGCSDCEVYFELDWIASPNTVFRPDIVVVCGDSPSRFLETTPVLVAEILSQSTRQRDMIYKRESYLHLGVRYYVIIDPERSSAELLSLDGDRYAPVSDQRLLLHPDCEIELNLASLFDSL